MPVTQTATPGGVTIVTQTRVRAGRDDEFSAWQKRISTVASESPGFIEQTVMPPNPPAQIDWVILQRFVSLEAANLLAEFQRAARHDRARVADAGWSG